MELTDLYYSHFKVIYLNLTVKFWMNKIKPSTQFTARNVNIMRCLNHC